MPHPPGSSPFGGSSEDDAERARELARVRQTSRSAVNPELAAFLSLLIPGAGHFYLGEYRTGCIFLAFAVAGSLFILPWLVCMLIAAVSAYLIGKRRNGDQVQM